MTEYNYGRGLERLWAWLARLRVFALESGFFMMDWLASLSDPNAVCVGLLLLALTLVWAYVMLWSGRKQPVELSTFYETTGQGKRSGGKIKPKGKQVSCRLVASVGIESSA